MSPLMWFVYGYSIFSVVGFGICIAGDPFLFNRRSYWKPFRILDFLVCALWFLTVFTPISFIVCGIALAKDKLKELL